MAKQPLTDPQKQLYDWIVSYMKENKCGPSVRQMMLAMGLKSPAPIQSRLSYLKEKGWITWERGKSRTLKIVETQYDFFDLAEKFCVLSDCYRVAQEELRRSEEIIRGKDAENTRLRAQVSALASRLQQLGEAAA